MLLAVKGFVTSSRISIVKDEDSPSSTKFPEASSILPVAALQNMQLPSSVAAAES